MNKGRFSALFNCMQQQFLGSKAENRLTFSENYAIMNRL